MTWSIMGILKWSPGGVVAWYLPNRSTTACSCGSTVYDESKIMPSRINRPTAQGRYGISLCQGSLGPRLGGTRRAYSSKDSIREDFSWNYGNDVSGCQRCGRSCPLLGTPGKKARHDSRSWFRAIRSLSDWLRSDE